MNLLEAAAARVGIRKLRGIASLAAVLAFALLMVPAFVELEGFWANVAVRVPGGLLMGLSVGFLVGSSRWAARRRERQDERSPAAGQAVEDV